MFPPTAQCRKGRPKGPLFVLRTGNYGSGGLGYRIPTEVPPVVFGVFFCLPVIETGVWWKLADLIFRVSHRAKHFLLTCFDRLFLVWRLDPIGGAERFDR